MKKLFTVLVLIISTTTLAQESERLKLLAPAEYEQKVEGETVQLIDIRTPAEYEAGSIEGAENIDFLAEGFLSKMAKFNRNEPLYIYCRSGNRTLKAADQLFKMGFENITDLKGGYKAWKEFEEK